MLRNSIIAGAFAVAALGLTGCELYFDEPNDSDTWSYCDETGCWTCDDWGCWPSDGSGGSGGSQPGFDCGTNADCAAGCYCNAQGVCEEAGFCSNNDQCPDGFVCDDRASCVPEDSTGDNTCETDGDCPDGSYCDEASGECVGSWGCTSTEQCGPGFVCDDRNTCVPQPCEDNSQCLEGCYCDTDAGECVESEPCDADGTCPAEGFVCDDRDTCVPGEEPQLVCQGTVTCETIPPACPLGSTPAIDDNTGCYTGDCIDNAECPDGNPCASNTEDQCLEAAECTTVYSGTDCTDPNGNACNANEADCTCESYSFASCNEASSPE